MGCCARRTTTRSTAECRPSSSKSPNGNRTTLTVLEGAVELKCRPSREADIFGSFPKRLWSSLAKVQIPTEVLYGQSTYPFIAGAVARWMALNPHVSGHTLAGGHCFMQEDAETAARRVTAFLLR